MSGKVPFYACIHKGIFYYRDAANGSWSFNSIDLASGRTEELEKCNDYTVLGDRLFLIKKGSCISPRRTAQSQSLSERLRRATRPRRPNTDIILNISMPAAANYTRSYHTTGTAVLLRR